MKNKLKKAKKNNMNHCDTSACSTKIDISLALY